MTPATIALIIFVCAVALFVSDVLPMGLVVFSVPLALCFSGVITPQEIFAAMMALHLLWALSFVLETRGRKLEDIA